MCFGLLVYVTGETLAAQAIGSLKERVGTEKKPCRVCEITADTMAYLNKFEYFKTGKILLEPRVWNCITYNTIQYS